MALVFAKKHTLMDAQTHNVGAGDPYPLATKADCTTGPGINVTAASQPDFSVIKSLEAIQCTPFANSLAARIVSPIRTAEAVQEYYLRDWEAESEWLNLMDDIHGHHALAQ